eukprot:jgi/Ulvmu1/10858/UM007_0032.1
MVAEQGHAWASIELARLTGINHSCLAWTQLWQEPSGMIVMCKLVPRACTPWPILNESPSPSPSPCHQHGHAILVAVLDLQEPSAAASCLPHIPYLYLWQLSSVHVAMAAA